MLTDAILHVRTEGGELRASLPQALALLCDGSLAGFDGLAAHQRHSWELFLYQVAAVALARSGEGGAAADNAAWRALADAQAWRARLAALTPGAESAWSLVTDDPTVPALLQPPIRLGLGRYAVAGRTPDEIDVLITAKGHDIKPARAEVAEERHWLFALVSLQTMQGYSGRGNFGIAHMNGGFGSRPLLMLTPSRDWPARFRRGVQAALAARTAALATQDGYYAPDGLPLLWLEPWDTEHSLPLKRLDPLFVEVCRRIRLVRGPDDRIAALGRPSEVPRVAVPEAAKGVLGDAWTPVQGGMALTVGPAGFDYRRLASLFSLAETIRPAAMEPPPGHRGSAWLHAVVLVRGQGKTEGLHERWVPIPGPALRGFASAGDANALGQTSTNMVAEAGAARDALRHALLMLLQGGAEKPDFEDERPREWLDRLHREIDEVFFQHLFATLEHDGDAGQWRTALVALVRRLFGEAAARLSPPEMRRERAHAVASLVLGARLKKAGLMQADKTQATDELEKAR